MFYTRDILSLRIPFGDYILCCTCVCVFFASPRQCLQTHLCALAIISPHPKRLHILMNYFEHVRTYSPHHPAATSTTSARIMMYTSTDPFVHHHNHHPSFISMIILNWFMFICRCSLEAINCGEHHILVGVRVLGGCCRDDYIGRAEHLI